MECQSSDSDLGTFPTMQTCADSCKATTDCKYFIYGKASKAGKCYHEHTTTADCTEGFEDDAYAFAELAGALRSNKYSWRYFITLNINYSFLSFIEVT